MSDGARSVYSIDTSALIDGLERYYPEQTFPGLWARVDDLINEERFLISEEVWEEIESKDAVVRAWCEPRKDSIVIATDSSIATEVQHILTAHDRLVMNLKNRNRADPFVIALAALRNGTVVTGEGSDGTANRPKIPFVCQRLGISCIRFTDVPTLEGWTF